MLDYEPLEQDIEDIGRQIFVLGTGLELDWGNQTKLRALVREALDEEQEKRLLHEAESGNRKALAKIELFGLIALMNRTMEKCANLDQRCHGDEHWKAIARALWTEIEARRVPAADA